MKKKEKEDLRDQLKRIWLCTMILQNIEPCKESMEIFIKLAYLSNLKSQGIEEEHHEWCMHWLNMWKSGERFI
jgi:hypothetical protein